MTIQRTCQACDGFGNVQVPTEGENGLAPTRWLIMTCVPCLGSGHITEHIGAEDAVADAETLRCYWRMYGNTVAQYCGCDAHWSPFWPKATTVSEYLVAGGSKDVSVKEDVRAAFRAVPGLRG